MATIKYYYKDSEGNTKRYRGKVEEKDGKFFGTLIESKVIEKESILEKESEGLEEVGRTLVQAWKDIDGNEFTVTETDNVVNNEVIKYYVKNIPVEFNPGFPPQTYFTYKDENRKIKQYDGEVIEENGKYYGTL